MIFRKSAVELSRVTEYVSVKVQEQLPKVPELSDPDSPAVNVDGNGLELVMEPTDCLPGRLLNPIVRPKGE